MNAGVSASLETFRDPAGSLRIEGDHVFRIVRAEFAADVLAFLRSDLAVDWIATRRLIPTTVLDAEPDGRIWLEHEKVFFPSYPWEWTPSQLVAAAELTLDFCEALLPSGRVLKDATPLNILFDGPHPIFVDVLSVETRDLENPLWLAYGQFVRTFLLPLAAYKYLGWPLSATLNRRDGYEPDDLYIALPWLRRWFGPCRSLITLPHLLEGRLSFANSKLRHTPEVASSVLQRTFKNLRGVLSNLRPERDSPSRWSDYPESANHYAAEDHAAKHAFVQKAMELMQPATVLDLGANTGVYSRVAAGAGANVVAWDTDVAATEKNWAQAQHKLLPILPLVANVARPTPATGWKNLETLSLLDRAGGRFDGVMMLGLLHHLLLSDQIPLPAVAAELHNLSRRWAIVEWIPTSDVRFSELCRGREKLYGHLDEQEFLRAFEPFFTPLLREELKNGRLLFLLKK